MKTLTKLTLAVTMLLASVALSNAQDYRIQQQPFGGGWNVYDQRGQLQQTIQRQPFGNGYNGYGPHQEPLYQIRQQPFGGGYDVHTLRQSYRW
jgi:hypothetical protein